MSEKNKMYYRNQHGDFVPVPFYYDTKSTTISDMTSKEKWVTVSDGWRGSLKRDFWVRDYDNHDWKLIEDCELIARDDEIHHSFIVKDDEEYESYKELKFKPFSIEEPPPRDWLAEVSLAGISRIRYFNKVEGTTFCFIEDGKSSKTSENITNELFTWDRIKWLNIEEVPND